jgi:hypothetical protein
MPAKYAPAVLLLLLTASVLTAADAPRLPMPPQGGDGNQKYSTALGDIEVALVPDKPAPARRC